MLKPRRQHELDSCLAACVHDWLPATTPYVILAQAMVLPRRLVGKCDMSRRLSQARNCRVCCTSVTSSQRGYRRNAAQAWVHPACGTGPATVRAKGPPDTSNAAVFWPRGSFISIEEPCDCAPHITHTISGSTKLEWPPNIVSRCEAQLSCNSSFIRRRAV